MMNLRQTHTLPGGETVTLVSWSYGKKHSLALHDYTTPIWIQLLPPPVLSELNTEEDRLVAWFKIDFPLARQGKRFRATKFAVEIRDDLGQSVNTTLQTTNSASLPRGSWVYTPFRIESFPRGSRDLIVRFPNISTGQNVDFRIPNPDQREPKPTRAQDLPATSKNGDLTVKLESFLSVKPQFIVDAYGEHRGEKTTNAAGELLDGFNIAPGEERRVRPHFTAYWKNELNWPSTVNLWRVTDASGNVFASGNALSSFLPPSFKNNLKLEAWFRGPPVKNDFDGILWDAGFVNLPDMGKMDSSNLTFRKDDVWIDRIQIFGKYNLGVGRNRNASIFAQYPLVRLRVKLSRADDEIYLQATDENGRQFRSPKQTAKTDWLLPTEGVSNDYLWNMSKYNDISSNQDMLKTKQFFLDVPKGVKKIRLKFGIVHARKVEFVIPPIR